jgi:hypothetical protein
MRHPPYHLRTNKAVDRLLLVSLLRELGKTCKEFTYYSLAGPFLEDLRVMDHYFPDMRLVSLESNEQTVRRQKFHRFNSRIDIRNITLKKFLLTDYVPGEKDVFWLDYTDLRYMSFLEFQTVLTAVPSGSVVRITLRAEPELDIEVLRDRVPDELVSQIQEQMEKAFEDEFQRVLPHPPAGVFASPQDFARMVQLMVRRAASIALDTGGSDRDFLPVQSTYYSDNTNMVSVTGVVCERNGIEETKLQLRSVRFADFEWQAPKLINIPALSVKEQLFLEHLLPVSSDQDAGELLHKALDYKIDNREKASRHQLAHYAECYRDYPNFVRIMI